MTGIADLTAKDRRFLLALQRRALRYFLDNQTPTGLVLDRQRNHGPRRATGLCSTAATGMGCIALALASASPYRLLAPADAVARVRVTLEAALHALPHERGILPHFLDPTTGTLVGADRFSTIDSGWLVAGGLWAAEFLRDPELRRLAAELYRRVDWHYWTAPEGSDRRGL